MQLPFQFFLEIKFTGILFHRNGGKLFGLKCKTLLLYQTILRAISILVIFQFYPGQHQFRWSTKEQFGGTAQNPFSPGKALKWGAFAFSLFYGRLPSETDTDQSAGFLKRYLRPHSIIFSLRRINLS